jgi:hypothetical protein
MVMAVSGDDTAERYGISVNKLFPASQYGRGSIPAGDDQLFTDASARHASLRSLREVICWLCPTGEMQHARPKAHSCGPSLDGYRGCRSKAGLGGGIDQNR